MTKRRRPLQGRRDPHSNIVAQIGEIGSGQGRPERQRNLKPLRLQPLLRWIRPQGQRTLNAAAAACLSRTDREGISKHVTVERDKVQFKLDRGEGVSTLAIDIEIPAPSAPQLAT